MRVSFSPGEVKDVREFFSQEVSFLDIYVTREQIFLVSNRTDMYAHMGFSVASIDNYHSPIAFRLNRKEFLSLLTEGLVVFYVGEDLDTITITFEAKNGLEFEMTRSFQQSDLSSISDYFSILEKSDRFSTLKLSNLSSYMPLLRGFNSIVLVEDGVARVSDPEGHITAYVKTVCENLCLSTSTLHFLLKNGSSFFRFQNHIIARGNNCVVIALQSRASSTMDFDWVMRRGKSHHALIDATPAYLLARRCSASGSASINFDSGLVVFKDDKASFRTKIKVLETSSYKSQNNTISLDEIDFDAPAQLDTESFPKLLVPVKFFKEVLNGVDRSNLRVSLMRDFITIDSEERVFFVLGRSEARD